MTGQAMVAAAAAVTAVLAHFASIDNKWAYDDKVAIQTNPDVVGREFALGSRSAPNSVPLAAGARRGRGPAPPAPRSLASGKRPARVALASWVTWGGQALGVCSPTPDFFAAGAAGGHPGASRCGRWPL